LDNRRKSVLLASVIVAAAVILALALYGSNNNGGTPAGPPAVGPGSNVSGGNSTGITGGKPAPQRQPINLLAPPSSFPFVEKWVSQYNNNKDRPGTVHVDYTDEVDYLGSNIYSNTSDFLGRHLADMAITGRAPVDSGNFTFGPMMLSPVSPQAIAVVYNIPGFPDVPSGLKLDRATLGRVLDGNITRWSDPAIKGLNPGVNLPDAAIVVVHEGRPHSATGLLEQYLIQNATRWPEKSIAAESADSLSTVVRQTPYSVGYVEFTYAVQTRMTFAALQNADGKYVEPSMSSIGAAIYNGTMSTTTSDGLPVMSSAQLGNGSYPIVGLYYYSALENKPAVLDFAKWISSGEGQQVLKDLHYPSIYESSAALRPYAEMNGTQSSLLFKEEAMTTTNLTQNEGESVYAQVAAQGANVYVVWEESMDDPPGNDHIFFRRSTDGGATFANTVNMSNNLGFSEHPQLAVSGANVYVGWSDDSSEVKGVMLSASTDAGRSFGHHPAVIISNPDMDSYNMEIAAAGSNVYVVWQEQAAGGEEGEGAATSIVLRSSADYGATFGPPVTVATGAGSESFPKVAASGDSVHVTWRAKSADSGLYYAKSDDRGAANTFSSPILISGDSNSNPVGEAQIAAYENDVHVIWGGLYDTRVDGIYHVSSSDGGKTFGKPSRMGLVMMANPQNVELAVAPGDKGYYSLYVAGQSDVSAGNEDIIIILVAVVAASGADSFSTSGGAPVNVSHAPAASECPSIAVSDGNIYVTWEDLEPGNHDIFLARGRA
jgi:ABC-type phosphate transport system substrate-binding protein